MRRYWEPEIETAPLEKLREIQENRMKTLVRMAYEKTTYYRREFDQIGVKPEDIQTLEDFQGLPLTKYTPDMSPSDFLAIPFNEVTNILTSGGTTGPPKIIYLSNNDLEHWKLLWARFAVMFGIRHGDVFMPTFAFPAIFDGSSSPEQSSSLLVMLVCLPTTR